MILHSVPERTNLRWFIIDIPNILNLENNAGGEISVYTLLGLYSRIEDAV